jgi:hypothetical protein
MYSPLRASTSFTDSRLRSLLKTQDSTPASLPDSFLVTETKKVTDMTESFSKSLRTKIRQEVLKSPGKKSVSFEVESEAGEKQLMRRGEDYARHVMGQISRSDEEKQREREKVRVSVNRALGELDEIRVNEGERLQLRVAELKKNYQMSITRLERSVMKQIEQLRSEFTEEIHNEEVESYRRIKQATEKLANSIAPETKRAVMEKVFRPAEPLQASNKPVPPPIPQPRSLSSKRASINDYNTPEKKKLSMEALQRLSESRRKVQQLSSAPVTTVESEASSPKRQPRDTSDSELQMDDLEYLESRARYAED